jgi:hypothetical protein
MQLIKITQKQNAMFNHQSPIFVPSPNNLTVRSSVATSGATYRKVRSSVATSGATYRDHSPLSIFVPSPTNRNASPLSLGEGLGVRLLLLLFVTLSLTKGFSQSIIHASAYLDTNTFAPAIIINLEVENLEQVKQINCEMSSIAPTTFMANDSLFIENKYGSLFFKNNGRYKQAYGKLIMHRIELTRGDYDRIKLIEFSLINNSGIQGQKTTITLR